MYKLVILIEQSTEWQEAEEKTWPAFLHLVENMPGLKSEAVSRVETELYGAKYVKMHELFFESLLDAEKAMSAPEGQEAGKLLQRMTGGHLTLFIAEHKEDTAENLRKYRQKADGSS